MKIKFKILTVLTVIGSMMCSSCDKFFDISTDDMLDAKDSYEDKSGVYAGMIGLSASFREVADHHIILSELLGDLMEPTTKAPDNCWDIFRYKGTNGNSFASPAPYYRVIINCNEFLKNVVRYNKDYAGVLPENIYRGMISSALTFRAWSYLQLGKLYGEAIYYDVVFTDNNGEMPSKVMKLDELVEELIYNLKTGVDGINGFQTLDWNKLVAPESTTPSDIWSRVSVDANVLLCELYLWAKDYTNAAKTGINFVAAPGENYRLNVFNESGSNHAKWWYAMFKRGFDGDRKREVCTYVPFDFDKNQKNKLQYYFSSIAPNVNYFGPTMTSLLRFTNQYQWGTDRLTNKKVLVRGSDMHRLNGTIDYENGTTVICKYHVENFKSYSHDAPIFIYRAAEVYLMIAEALSALGGENNLAAADSLINVGLKTSWKGGFFQKPFDAPIYSSTLSVCPGLRGRVSGLAPDYARLHIDTLLYPGKTEQQKIEKMAREKFVIDSLIAEETALELAYEGKRWFTLMRIARNTDNPKFLAQQVARKFNTGEAQYYEKWLQNPQNWFVKWDQKNILNELENKE